MSVNTDSLKGRSFEPAGIRENYRVELPINETPEGENSNNRARVRSTSDGSSADTARLERIRGRLIAAKVPFAEPISLDDAEALEIFGAPTASTRRLALRLEIEVRPNASRVEAEEAIRRVFPSPHSSSEPATVVQRAFLRQLDSDLPEDLSRAEAAFLIEQAKSHPSLMQQNMLKFFGDPSWQSVSLQEATERLEAMLKVEPERRDAWEAFSASCRRLYREVTPNMVEFDSWQKHLPEGTRTRAAAGRGSRRRAARFPQMLSYAKALLFSGAIVVALLTPFFIGNLT